MLQSVSSIACTCPPDRLCDDCLGRALTWLATTAARRGQHWAETVAERRPELLARPWPALEGRAAEIAAAKVIDLSADQRVLERLLRELARSAAEMWEKLRARQ
jgi:hypothetical protein